MSNVVYVSFTRNELSLTKAELAERLRYSVRHVEKLTALGMPSTLRGRRRTYKETACRNWLAEQEKEIAHAR